MNGIWSLDKKEDSNTVKFKNPSATVTSADFGQYLTQAQQDSVIGMFNDMSSGAPVSLENISQMMPTRQNVAVLSDYMQEQIKEAFKQNGIPSDPPVSFSQDSSGNVTATGDRADIEKINQMFDYDTKLGRQMHDFMAMASEMPRFERAMEYTEKYEQAQSRAEIDALNREYADLFDGKDHSSVSFEYGDSGLDVDTKYMA